MNYLKVISTAFFSILVAACNHPIEIVGDGDVTSALGNRSCYLEDYRAGKENCAKNTVIGEYNETYYATPRSGWSFDRWEGCQSSASNVCSFAVPAETVRKAWGATAPPLIAFFVRIEKLDTFNGEWHSARWNYSFLITGNIGIATLSNSAQYNVGEKMLEIEQANGNFYSGRQLFTNGQWYEVSGEIDASGAMQMQGGGYNWEMTRVQTTETGT